jgi:hypothetical protein
MITIELYRLILQWQRVTMKPLVHSLERLRLTHRVMEAHSGDVEPHHGAIEAHPPE